MSDKKIPNTLGANYRIDVKSRVFVIYNPTPFKSKEGSWMEDEDYEEDVPEEIDEDTQNLMLGINKSYNSQLSEIANKGYMIRAKEIFHSVQDGIVKVYLEWEETHFEEEE